MSKQIKIILSLLVLSLITYILASPYIALYQLKNAVQAKDADKVSQFIDYPSLRQSVKDQMNAYMMKEVAKASNSKNDGMEAAGALFASTMVNGMVDGFVTPQGLKMAFDGKSVNPLTGAEQPTSASGESNKLANFQENFDTDMGYKSLNQFNITLKDKKQADKNMNVVMQREGLSWKIKAVELPLDK